MDTTNTRPQKYLTFSYDDGVKQDARLIELFNRYGMKATFNLNSGLLGTPNAFLREGVWVRHDKVSPEEVRTLYAGHEVAAHTLTHPNLTELTDDAEIIRQVEEDRLRLSELAGYEVVGFAYPGGGTNANAHTARLVAEKTGVRYARTTIPTGNFETDQELCFFKPTIHHHNHGAALRELAKQFVALKPEKNSVLYIWGHSYEFDIHDTWAEFEEVLKILANRPDIVYATNREILLNPAIYPAQPKKAAMV